MQTLIMLLKILSIPLLIIIGELHMNERTKTILLLVVDFLYNSFLGSVTSFAMIMISVLESSYLFILSAIIIGILILAYLITINMYVKRKLYINILIYIIIIIVGFLSGLFLY